MPLVACLISVISVSCSSSDTTDEWSEKGWQSNGYPTVTYKNQSYIKVPCDGGTFVFHCKNSDFIWLTEHLFVCDGNTEASMTDDSKDINRYSNSWCDVKTQGDSLVVVIKPNEALARKAHIGVTSGDMNEVFRFYQESPYYAEKGSNPARFVGDWVVDPTADVDGFYAAGQYRYSFHEDGTYISTFEGFGTTTPFEVYSGDWLDFSSHMYAKTYNSTSLQRWDCEVSGGKLYIKFDEDGSRIPFVKVEKSGEPVRPIYSLDIQPSKSTMPIVLMPGEPYNLTCTTVAKGNAYEMNKVMLIRETYSNDERPSIYEWDHDFVRDTIDISAYADKDYCFSILMTAPDKNYTVSYRFVYDARYTASNFVDRKNGKDIFRSFDGEVKAQFKTRK